MCYLIRSQSKGSEEEVEILPAIYTAVINNRESAKEQLGGKLIERLSQLSYDAINTHFFKNSHIDADYTKFKKILNINA